MASRAKKLTIWTIVGGVASLVIAGVLMSYSAGREAQEEIRLAKEAGWATTPQDMAEPILSGDENAAGHYQMALRSLKGIDGNKRRLIRDYLRTPTDVLERSLGRAFGGHIDDKTVDRVLTEYQPIFKSVQEATAKPHLNFERPWEQGIALAFSEYSELREIGDAYRMRAMLDAKQGRFGEAIESLRTMRSMSRHMYEEPTIISQLVGISNEKRANAYAVELILKTKSPVFAAEAQKFLSETTPGPDLKRGLRGEVFYAVTGPDQLKNDPSMLFSQDSPEAKKMAFLYRISYFRNKAQALTLRRYREAFSKIPDDDRDGEKTREVMRQLDETIQADKSIPGLMASQMTSVFAQIAGSSAAKRTYDVLFQAAAKAATILATTGKAPESLPGFTDPTNGTPIQYKKTAKGFVVYGLGVNGKDDGGNRNGDRTIEIENGVVKLGGY